ncbi:MAG: LemA family protein [Bacillota bacterium]|nr:LemA family protein [Bacillota bacterium]
MPQIIIGIAVVLIILWFIGAYNGLVKLRNMVREAFSTMDVFMKKRYDLIPNLVETVKGYAKHEQGTLEKVISARNAAASAKTVESRIEGESALTGTLKTLFAVAEAYPDLKANTNFMDLQKQLQSVEGEIANSRKYYNAVVRDYNIKTEAFPSVIVANLFGFRREPMFEIAGEERANVKVQF